MSPVALSLLALAAATVHSVSAQSTFPPTALADKHFAYPTGIPYKVDTDEGLIRGHQAGYNICNSTTENQHSLCQTTFLNSIDDFCLWAPIEPESMVANTEGEMVAWCTKPGRGTRLIPNGALRGVQFMKTPDYVQVVGFIDQSKINIKGDDWGGEMDPHGADLRGNPMGGLFYSNAFSGNKDNYVQVIEWHNFMGGNAFCLKACDPAGPNAAHFCEHRLDRIGCQFNAPNNAQNGTFEACEGDNQDYPGVYTVDGQVMTYTQPPEDQGAIATMPYTARIPSSSNCVAHTSEVLYKALAAVTAPGDSSSAPAAPTGTGKPSGSSGGAGTTKGSSTGTAGAAGASQTGNDAETLVVGGMMGALGVVFSMLFFA
ncbi:hypothetical protein BDZ94DRAFT_1195960 [Collybia nuda]|uniref:Macrofage activating glycoprotein n=1 Tax=Collybia nuda TaxID=64659 RepID=A0A9P6CDF1_9AGAR|nr:hypothetical protein BDZ94DRAFT_1195960 [Collybia nuda]